MEVEREIEKAGSSWSHVSLACQEDGCTWNVPFPKLAYGMCIKLSKGKKNAMLVSSLISNIILYLLIYIFSIPVE